MFPIQEYYSKIQFFET
jgi:hypothetical protein